MAQIKVFSRSSSMVQLSLRLKRVTKTKQWQIFQRVMLVIVLMIWFTTVLTSVFFRLSAGGLSIPWFMIVMKTCLAMQLSLKEHDDWNAVITRINWGEDHWFTKLWKAISGLVLGWLLNPSDSEMGGNFNEASVSAGPANFRSRKLISWVER